MSRRFARLQFSPPFLVFCMDVSAAGGVAPNYLRAQIEIWDRLAQDLIAYLRDELRKLGAPNSTGSAPQANARLSEPERAPDAVTTIQ